MLFTIFKEGVSPNSFFFDFPFYSFFFLVFHFILFFDFPFYSFFFDFPFYSFFEVSIYSSPSLSSPSENSFASPNSIAKGSSSASLSPEAPISSTGSSPHPPKSRLLPFAIGVNDISGRIRSKERIEIITKPSTDTFNLFWCLRIGTFRTDFTHLDLEILTVPGTVLTITIPCPNCLTTLPVLILISLIYS